MERVVADATAQPRFEMLLLGVFGAVALILVSIGIYSGVTIVLTLAALLATCIPARKATRIEPVVALRSE